MKEIEAKIPLQDPAVVLSLIGKRLKIARPLEFQRDVYYDHPTLQIRRDDRVVRVRATNERTQLAYKGPRESHAQLIKRDEFETSVGDRAVAEDILAGLGFEPVEVVEKVRLSLASDHYRLDIALDRVPFLGTFVEVEGGEADILRFCSDIDLDLSAAVRHNYTELFVIWCREHDVSIDKPRARLSFKDEVLMLESKR